MLSPIAKKRLKRFKQKKRSYWSFKILLALYLLSLPAELICNNKPLFVKFDGKSYFPIFKFYPENTFIKEGRETRPDYKKLNKTDIFSENDENYMIFPFVPYGPYESLDPESLRKEEQVTLTLMPKRYVGSIDINEELQLVSHDSAAPFLGETDNTVTGSSFTDSWKLNKSFIDAIRQRFENIDSSREEITIEHKDNRIGKLTLTIARYSERPQAPTTVRLMLRQSEDSLPETKRLTFNRSQLVSDPAELWPKLSDQTKTLLIKAAENGFTQEYIDDFDVTVLGGQYRVKTERNDVRWPHPPTQGHLLGIDSTGRDVFARIYYGLRTSMTFALILVVLSMTLGITMGAIQGFFGGKTDITCQRFIEIWSAMPFLYIMILMGSIYGTSFALLIFCYAIFNWIGISYYMRAEFLRLRKQQFVDAAKCMGVPSGKIIFKHILPNAITPVITLFPFSLVGAIGALAALDYLGFGLPSPTPSWGELFQQAQQFRWAWWLILYPFLSIFTVMILGVFIGEGVRDAFDPRPFSKME